MAGFALYIPKTQELTEDQLKDLGIWELSSDKNPEYSIIERNGPDGGSGTLMSWRQGHMDFDFPLSVNLDDQEWSLAPGKDYWIGCLKDSMPTPQDLLRLEVQAGINVQLLDGNQWCVPVARQLPHRSGLDDQGKYSRIIEERFQEYFDATEAYVEILFAGSESLLVEQNGDSQIETVDITLSDTYDFSCQALAINYRINPQIVSALGLLDDDKMVTIIKAALDYDSAMNIMEQKKTESSQTQNG